jgi:hypothetical protein
MAAAAVRLAGQLFEDLGKIRVLFVGAGEMIELVATHFAARHPKAMAIANRTLERGESWPPLWRRGHAPGRAARPPARIRRRVSAAPPARCPSSAWARWSGRSSAAAPPHVHGGPGRAARHRTRSRRLDDVYLYTVDDLSHVVQTARRKAPGRRGPGRGHHRRRRAELRALAGPAQHRAADPGSSTPRPTTGAPPNWRVRASCWPRAKTWTRCWKPWPAA